jgi:hypothetical protein
MPRGVMFKMAASAQEKAFCAGIRQDNVTVKCATTFSDTLWKESANQEVYLRLVQVWEELDYRFDIAASHVGLTSSACKV